LINWQELAISTNFSQLFSTKHQELAGIGNLNQFQPEKPPHRQSQLAGIGNFNQF